MPPEELYRKEVDNSQLSRQQVISSGGASGAGYSPSQKDKRPSFLGIYKNKLERPYKRSVTRK
jgi:hypothetical protein